MNDDFPQDCDIGLAEQDILRAARLFRELASLGHPKGDSLKRAAMHLTCCIMELDIAFGAKNCDLCGEPLGNESIVHAKCADHENFLSQQPAPVDLDEVFERR